MKYHSLFPRLQVSPVPRPRYGRRWRRRRHDTNISLFHARSSEKRMIFYVQVKVGGLQIKYIFRNIHEPTLHSWNCPVCASGLRRQSVAKTKTIRKMPDTGQQTLSLCFSPLCLSPCDIHDDENGQFRVKSSNKEEPFNINKFALLWGEAQKKIAYSYLKVT